MSADSAAGMVVLNILAGPEVQTLLSARYVVIAIGTLVSWETILHFHHDVRIIRKLFTARTRRTFRFGDAIFLIIRYSLIWYIISGYLFFFGRPASCTAVKYNIVLSILTGIIALEALFLFRVYLIWGRNKWIAAALGSLILVDLGMTLAVGVASPVVKLTNAPEPFPWCTLTPYVGPFGEYNWLPRIIYDFLVLVVTILRLWTMPKIEGSQAQALMRKWIVNSNAIYFGMVFAIFLVGFIGSRLDHNAAAGLIWSTLAQGVPLVIGARLILFTPSRQEEMKGSGRAGTDGGYYPGGGYNYNSPLPRVHQPRPSPRDSIATSTQSHRRRHDSESGSVGMQEATGTLPATAEIMMLPPAKLASETSFFGSVAGTPHLTSSSDSTEATNPLHTSPTARRASVFNEAQLEEAGWVVQSPGSAAAYADPTTTVDLGVESTSPRSADIESMANTTQQGR
ncbi:hypothetical protein OC846_006155 [Tilletia horrida]|uniref:Uncharacterized protein n=1 Tax=Tilletia horrida TaxID=155126 RepID=A0AAN6GM61_9BASI|nr:hypothetical protein OC845_006184 [Tilletia horrida]KAK0544204.1 hypothetical protein OC846_006155 [Tilletia horrida]KAK0560370.1 hypothetical protein OC861_006308 [Tilletia horrida]